MDQSQTILPDYPTKNSAKFKLKYSGYIFLNSLF